MTPETVSRAIQLILAPVVMVTACAILAGGLLTRYAAINDRLRAGANAAQRDALLSNYGASLIFIGDMFVIALAAIAGVAWLPGLVLIVFLAGIAMLFAGLLLILLEVRTSHESVQYEVGRVTGLGAEPPRNGAGTIAN